MRPILHPSCIYDILAGVARFIPPRALMVVGESRRSWEHLCLQTHLGDCCVDPRFHTSAVVRNLELAGITWWSAHSLCLSHVPAEGPAGCCPFPNYSVDIILTRPHLILLYGNCCNILQWVPPFCPCFTAWHLLLDIWQNDSLLSNQVFSHKHQWVGAMSDPVMSSVKLPHFTKNAPA